VEKIKYVVEPLVLDKLAPFLRSSSMKAPLLCIAATRYEPRVLFRLLIQCYAFSLLNLHAIAFDEFFPIFAPTVESRTLKRRAWVAT
jgi:hypothetical protein